MIRFDIRLQFSIVFKSRHNNKMDRKDVIDKVAALVPPQCKADLSNPDIVILLEIFKVHRLLCDCSSLTRIFC